MPGSGQSSGKQDKTPKARATHREVSHRGKVFKRAGFTFLDEVIGCQKETEKINRWS